jgi:membrane-associated phospholipid phosphatase
VHGLAFGPGDYLVFFPAFLFSAFSIPLVLLALYFLLPFSTWTRLLLSCLVTLALTTFFKFFVGRYRPAPHVLPFRKVNLRSLENNHAMPSGDSAQAGVFMVALAMAWQQPLLLLAIPLTMFGRVYFGCHWIGDTIVGSVMGGLVSLGVSNGMDVACRNPTFSAGVPNLCHAK